MADSFLQTAPDSTGKMVQTTTKTVGGNTVHRQVVSVQTQRTRLGLYRSSDQTAGGTAILAAAHTALATTAGTGFLFLTNAVGSTTAVAVKALQLSLSASAATAMPTSPRIVLSRFAFTGTISTSGLTVAKRVNSSIGGLTADAANVAKLTTTITGQTTTAIQNVREWMVPSLLTAVGVYGVTYMWDPDSEDDELILGAGEGIAIQQLDAGTTTDVRRLAVSIAWEEFTAP